MTINDMITFDCICIGMPISFGGCLEPFACNYDPFVPMDDGSCFFIGDACGDGDSMTINDWIDEECICVGTPFETGGCLDLLACNFDSESAYDD